MGRQHSDCAFPGRGIVGGSRAPGTETTWSFLPPRCRPSQSPHCLPPSSFLLISSGIDRAPLLSIRTTSRPGERPALCRSTVLAQDQRGWPVADQDTGNLNLPWRPRASAPTSRSRSVSALVTSHAGRDRVCHRPATSLVPAVRRSGRQGGSDRRCDRNHPGLGYHLRTTKAPGRFSGEPGLERSMGRLRHFRLGYVLRCYHGVHRKPGFGVRRCN